jgi:hypothetical protein
MVEISSSTGTHSHTGKLRPRNKAEAGVYGESLFLRSQSFVGFCEGKWKLPSVSTGKCRLAHCLTHTDWLVTVLYCFVASHNYNAVRKFTLS